MTRIYILLIAILFLNSCKLNNHSEGWQVRQAILQNNMLSSFQNYRSIIARDADYYMIELRYPITFYFSLSVDGKSSSGTLHLRDSLLFQKIANPVQMTDRIIEDAKNTVTFMYRNSIKNFFFDNKSADGNFVLTFVICNDGLNSCEQSEFLSFHKNPLKQSRDTSIVDTMNSEMKIFKQFDLHWVSTMWRPNQQLLMTSRGYKL